MDANTDQPPLLPPAAKKQKEWPFWKWTVFWAVLHFLALLGLKGSLFILTHIPPIVLNLDFAIVALTWVETALVAPRLLLRWLWPSQVTPNGLITVLAVSNSLLWGMLLRSAWILLRRGMAER